MSIPGVLFQAGADVNIISRLGERPVVNAAKTGSDVIMELLLRKQGAAGAVFTRGAAANISTRRDANANQSMGGDASPTAGGSPSTGATYPEGAIANHGIGDDANHDANSTADTEETPSSRADPNHPSETGTTDAADASGANANNAVAANEKSSPANVASTNHKPSGFVTSQTANGEPGKGSSDVTLKKGREIDTEVKEMENENGKVKQAASRAEGTSLEKTAEKDQEAGELEAIVEEEDVQVWLKRDSVKIETQTNGKLSDPSSKTSEEVQNTPGADVNTTNENTSGAAVTAGAGVNRALLRRKTGRSSPPKSPTSGAGVNPIGAGVAAAGANVNLRRVSSGTRGPGYTAALHHSAVKGNARCLELLVAAGADVNRMDKRNPPPLTTAASSGSEACVKVLLDAGADVNVVMDPLKETALLKAVKGDHVACVKLLLESGADVNVVNKYNFTPLHYAVSNQNKELVKLLVDSGADVNTCSALATATSDGNVGTSELLLAAGADANSTAPEGSSL